MGRELTKRYATLLESKGVKNPILFAHDVLKSGKLREFSSFVIWELFHKLKLFPKEQYLKFTSNESIILKGRELDKRQLADQLSSSLRGMGIQLDVPEHNWKLLFMTKDKEIFGCTYPDDTKLYRSQDNGKSVTLIETFPEKIKSIFVSSQNTVFVCIKGSVYRGQTPDGPYTKVLDLGTSESFFRHNNAMTETPSKRLIIGEYGNVWDERGWRKIAYLYFSSDDGKTWQTSDFLIRQGINKHVHVVRYSKLFDRVYVADGDNKKKLWISDTAEPTQALDSQWTPINKFHIQMGGYTAVAEGNRKILFGTDYQGGTNFIVESADGKKFTKRIVPDPYRRSPIDNMVQRESKNGSEIWANLPYSTANTKCLLMYTADGGVTWNKVIEYSRASHTVWILNSAIECIDESYFAAESLRRQDRAVFRDSALYLRASPLCPTMNTMHLLLALLVVYKHDQPV